MAFDPNNPAASGMVLTFDDEFNTLSASSSGNGTTWTNHEWWGGPEGEAVSTPQNLSVHNGVLDITSTENNGTWTTGAIESTNSQGQGFAQKYGYFEIRAKIAAGQGLISTFFLMSNNHVTNGNAPQTEMDVLETPGNQTTRTFTTVHRDSGGVVGDAQNADNMREQGVDLSQSFHTYGVLWPENGGPVTFYLDGKPLMNAPVYDTTSSSPMMMIITDLLGTWSGQTNGSTPNSAHFQVDYVRAWQFADQHPTAVTPDAVSAPFGQAITNGSTLPGSSVASSGTTTTTPTTSGTTPSSGSSGSSSGTTSSSTTPLASTGTGPDTLVLHVSGDKFQGDAQFTLMVDGKQVGSIQDVTAVHSAGQWQDITVHGSFANAHTLTVNYQDQWGGSASQDRNLYVGSVTVDGHTLNGDQATSNTANNGYLTTAHGYAAVEPHTAIMDATGSATFNITGLAAPVVATTTPPPAPTPAPASSGSSTGGTIVTDPGTGPDTLVVHLTGDQWQGNPQFTLSVDGKVIGGPQDVVASHAAGQWQDVIFHGDFSQAKVADITFLNDAWNGSLSQDRNIYVDSITLDGHQLTGSQATSNTASNGAIAPLHAGDAVMDVNGTLAFNVAGLAASSSTSLTAGSGPTTNTTSLVDPGTGPDTLLVHISGDQWQGNPQFTLTVDGKQIASAQGVTVSHAAGQWQDVIFHGDFANAHEADINFTNDAWGGTAGLDRNVYVSSITLDGHQLTGAQATSNTATNGMIKDATPGDAVMDVNGKLAFNVTGFASSLAPSATDAAGHDVFVFNAPTQSGAFISTFDPGHDVLDLSTFLKAEGYTGTDPLADHVINLVQSGSNTAVTFDPTGHAANHGTTAITLDHVLPQDLHASNFVFHH